MSRVLILTLIIAAAASWGSAQTFSERKQRAVDLVKRGENAAALAELREMEAADPAAFRSEDLDYLLGVAAENAGAAPLAAGAFARVASRPGPLRTFALMHLSSLARATGNSLLERIYLVQIIAAGRGGSLAAGARSRLARLGLETSAYADASRWLLERTGGADTDAALQRDDTVLLAEALLRSGDANAARAVAARLLDSMPKADQPDDAAMLAARLLDGLDGANGLSVAEHMRRAGIFQYNREFAEARRHYEAVIAAEPNGQNGAEAAFQIGRGFGQVFDFVEALKWYERVLERYASAPVARDALLQAAAAYSRVGKTKEAKSRYQQFIERYPNDEKLDRAYLNMIHVSRDMGEDQDALKWAARAEEAFQGKPPAALAAFSRVLIYLSRNEWLDAVVAVDRLAEVDDLGSTLPGGTSRAELSFIRAYCLEQAGRFPEAIEGYLSIPDGREEYYGWRATERLKAMRSDERARSFVAQRIGQLSAGLEAKNSDDRRRNASALLRFETPPDVTAKALESLRSALRQLPRYAIPAAVSSQSPEVATPAAKLLTAFGIDAEAALEGARSPQTRLAEAEPAWRKVPGDLPVEAVSREQLEVLYPAPYRDELLRYAKPRAVDPRFMLAIMRQESRFNADARSNAAARGLMQFIATTSSKVAQKLDRDAFTQDELFYPATAVEFGAQYLADLNAMFPSEPDAVAAAYNGGEDNVKRWLARSRSNVPERYVPEIAFAQSKDYAMRVMNSYRIYRMLYDSELRPMSWQ